MPEIRPMFGCGHNTPFHFMDVWSHTLAALGAAPRDGISRLVMLFHDIGKPECKTIGDDGYDHFYGHPEKGAKIAERVLRRLKWPAAEIDAVCRLVLFHDADLAPEPSNIKRLLNALGEEGMGALFSVRRADAMAQSEDKRRERLGQFEEDVAMADEIIRERQCFRISGLAVDGRDVIAAGVPEGREVGEALNALLDMVIDGKARNERRELLECISRGLSADGRRGGLQPGHEKPDVRSRHEWGHEAGPGGARGPD